MKRHSKNYTQIFIATLLQIAVLAIEPRPLIQQSVNVVLVVWMAFSARRLTGSDRDFRILLALGLTPALVELIIPFATAPLAINLVKAASWIAFPLFLSARLFRELYRSPSVRIYELYGVFTLYILLGLGFANAHEVLYYIDPRSLTFATVGPGETPGFSEFLYFSFVTLGTLGYGDMAPVTHPARLLSMAEALVGLMFIAVVVGRMVGLETAQSNVIRARRPADERGVSTDPDP